MVCAMVGMLPRVLRSGSVGVGKGAGIAVSLRDVSFRTISAARMLATRSSQVFVARPVFDAADFDADVDAAVFGAIKAIAKFKVFFC